MEMHQVRYFLAVARTLNFTKAADECNVAQPSLSRAIQKLEEELGGELFRRERSFTHLTELGRTMLPILTRCYQAAEEARALGAAFRKGRSAVTVRVALSHTVNAQLIVAARSEVAKALPGVELHVERGTAPEVAERLKSGDAELGIACPLPGEWDRFDGWTLFQEPFELIVSPDHALANRSAVAAGELAGLPVLSRPYCEQASQFAELLGREGVQLASTDIMTSDRDAVDFVSANAGVAIMPRSSRPADRVRPLTIEGVMLERPVVLYAVAGRQRHAGANLFIKLLRAANWSAYAAS